MSWNININYVSNIIKSFLSNIIKSFLSNIIKSLIENITHQCILKCWLIRHYSSVHSEILSNIIRHYQILLIGAFWNVDLSDITHQCILKYYQTLSDIIKYYSSVHSEMLTYQTLPFLKKGMPKPGFIAIYIGHPYYLCIRKYYQTLSNIIKDNE
jgi:hypothetical protein